MSIITLQVSDTPVVVGNVDTTTPTGTDATIRFTARFTGIEHGTDLSGGQLRVHWTCGAHQKFVVITAQGVGTADGAAYVHPAGEATMLLDQGGFHTFELRFVGADDEVAVYIDDEYQYTLDVSAASNNSAYDASITFQATVGQTDPEEWTCLITGVMYTDYVGDDALVPMEIVDVGQYTQSLTGGTTRKYFLAATRTKLFIDTFERGAWVELMPLQNGHTRFLPFRDRLIIFDATTDLDSKVLQWNGIDAPSELETAPPVRFGTEHRTRLFAAGDRKYPLRVYFTGSRQPDLWFAPAYFPGAASFDAVTQAGYMDIPSVTGDEITGVYGEYYGNLIVSTKTGIWRVTGSSPQSFQVDNITKKVGGESPDGIVQIGNDLMIVGRQGVVTVQSAQSTGDIQTAMPSGAIADMWSSLPYLENRIDKPQLSHAYFEAVPSLNLAVLGMRGQGSTTLDKTMALGLGTMGWYGPWTFNPTCFKLVDIGMPVLETLMCGTNTGRVLLLHLGSMKDQGESYTTRYESPMISGRSLNPLLVQQEKTWRLLRLYLLPIGRYPITVRWRTDSNLFDDVVEYQVAKDEPVLSDTFRLDVDRLSSQDEIDVLEIVLDAKGKFIHFIIECDHEIVPQGYELEFLAGSIANE